FSMKKPARRKNSESSGYGTEGRRTSDMSTNDQQREIESQSREPSAAPMPPEERKVTNVIEVEGENKEKKHPSQRTLERKGSRETMTLNVPKLFTNGLAPSLDSNSKSKPIAFNSDKERLGWNVVPNEWKEKIIQPPNGIEDVLTQSYIGGWPFKLQKALKMLALKRMKVFPCNSCRSMFYNYIHYIMHQVIEKDDFNNHIDKVLKSCDFDAYFESGTIVTNFNEDVKRWTKNEDTWLKKCALEVYSEREKECPKDLYRPTNKWMESMRPLFVLFDHQVEGEVWIRKEELTKERGDLIVKDLLEHLSNEVIFCRPCGIFFTEGMGFVHHCLSFEHYRKVIMRGVTPEFDGPWLSDLHALTMILNMHMGDEYIKHVESSSPGELASNLKSAESCYQKVEDMQSSIPPQIAPVKEKFHDCIRKAMTPEGLDFSLLFFYQTDIPSCAPLLKQLQARFPLDKSSFLPVNNLGKEVIFQIYEMIYSSLTNHLVKPCFYCWQWQKVLNDMEYFDHFTAPSHCLAKHSYYFTRPEAWTEEDEVLQLEKERLHEAVQDVLLAYHRHEPMEFSELEDWREYFELLDNKQNLSCYCTTCNQFFSEYVLFIAHFWSKEHSDKIPLINDDMKRVMRSITNENWNVLVLNDHFKLEKTFEEYKDKLANPKIEFYVTIYARTFFHEAYRAWREEKKEIRFYTGEKDASRFVPTEDFRVEMEAKMKKLYDRANYPFFGPKSAQFVRYYTANPPAVLVNQIRAHIQQRRGIPYCHLCKNAFATEFDYCAHFGTDMHKLEKRPSDAGIYAALIWVVFKDKMAKYNPKDYVL
ncbi:hypothetical protein PFISCL1PPCAC_14165, partial [Pristionchus fissidentatus]